jgi:hypothetical protein
VAKLAGRNEQLLTETACVPDRAIVDGERMHREISQKDKS